MKVVLSGGFELTYTAFVGEVKRFAIFTVRIEIL